MKRKKTEAKTFQLERETLNDYSDEVYFPDDGSYCYQGFKLATGITLKPGEKGTFKLVRVKP